VRTSEVEATLAPLNVGLRLQLARVLLCTRAVANLLSGIWSHDSIKLTQRSVRSLCCVGVSQSVFYKHTYSSLSIIRVIKSRNM